MDIKTVVSTRGQIVIPKFVRESLGLHYGSQIILNVRNDKVVELRSIQRNITEFFGKGKNLHLNSDVVNIDEAITQAVCDNEGIKK